MDLNLKRMHSTQHINLNTFLIHTDGPVKEIHFEKAVYSSIVERSEPKDAVSTESITAKEVSYESPSQNGVHKMIFEQVYTYVFRWKLGI